MRPSDGGQTMESDTARLAGLATARPSQATRTGSQAPLWVVGAALAVTALGVALRVEHMLTFSPARGSDYRVYVEGARWILANGALFDANSTLQVSGQPPLWYALGALLLGVGLPERAIAAFAVLGFLVRHIFLWRLLRQAAPAAPRSTLIALALHAVLPLSVLMDGKVNPEGLHAMLFTVGVYLLWRLEQEARAPDGAGMSPRTAAWFGLVAGLAVLTKSTSIALVGTALALFGWHLVSRLRGNEAASPRSGMLLAPGLTAGLVFLLVVGWWWWPNLIQFGHPFPHHYDLARVSMTHRYPILTESPLYRRPLGWYLPFQFSYLDVPVAITPETPQPNFWDPIVAGTWTDYLNRGFCRLKGGGRNTDVWAGGGWPTTGDCMRVMRLLVRVGLLLTAATAAAWAWLLLAFVRTGGRRGSLVLPATVGLATLFTMLFAATYPFDDAAVVKPNYLLAVVTPLVACGGLALARLETSARRATVVHGIAAGAVAVVGFLVVAERWWVR